MTAQDSTTDLATRDRARGALLGLAVGDALGTTLEFTAPGTFAPIDDMVGGGPFGLEAGEWTDDTSMALCLAESLLEHGLDLEDQARRYVRWRDEGYMSVRGRCFDIGTTVSRALAAFERHGRVSAPADPRTAGNGSIMRLAPAVIWALDRPLPELVRVAAATSLPTHGAREAVDGCRYLALLLAGLLRGEPKARVLEPGYWDECLPGADPLAPGLAEIAAGAFRTRMPPEVKGSGYVVASLEAALWAFARTDSFGAGALQAVNLGDDADTTGAVYGQLAGAAYGEQGIPEKWRARVKWAGRITDTADRLLRAGAEQAGGPLGFPEGA
jgi:ADP-ribosyl-[dinitrogen reductase] hydrolase